MTAFSEQELKQMKSDAAHLLGRTGGLTTYKRHGKKLMSAMGKKGSKIRWDAYKKEMAKGGE